VAVARPERRAVAEFLTARRRRGTVVGATAGRCARVPPLTDSTAGARWNGWAPSVKNTHFQPGDQAGLTAEQVPRLRLLWAFGFPDTTSAWAQPTVVGGRLFVGGQNGIVYSLDARSGCIAWAFEAHSGARTSITIGHWHGHAEARSAKAAAYFADQQGYVYAVDAASGRLLWSRKVDEHPLVRFTGSPTLPDGPLSLPPASY